MKSIKIILFAFVLLFFTANCKSDGSQTLDPGIFEGLPDFSPSGSVDLDSYIENTFLDQGIQITVSPAKIDFNDSTDSFSIGDSKTVSFELLNQSGTTRRFTLQTYSVSTGYVILDEFKNNMGSWSDIEVANGQSKKFNIQFNADYYGTQTSTLVITADITGQITLPFTAKVKGGGESLKVVSGGSSCSDSETPALSYLDFYKIPTGSQSAQSLKVCNTGGDDIKVYSVSLSSGSLEENSAYFENLDFGGFDILTLAQIDPQFGLDFEPEFESSFSPPSVLPTPVGLLNASSYYEVYEDTSGTLLNNIIIEAGDYTKFNVAFSPKLELEAPQNTIYEALPANAVLSLNTSLGPIEIDLWGATAGYEPELNLSYRFSDDEPYTDINTLSNVSALDFGTLEVFLDSIPNLGRVADILVKNTGTGNFPLEFYPKDLVGYFEYYSDDDEPLSFPLILESGESKAFQIRYLPTPEGKDEETHWDVGQLTFNHNGSNGPDGQLTLIGNQSYGYAVEVTLNGGEVKHEYAENEAKGLCSIQIDGLGKPATQKTFVIQNNDPQNTLSVQWKFEVTEGTFTVTSDSGKRFTVEPLASFNLTLDFMAASSMTDGDTLTGTLKLTNTLKNEDNQSLEDLYARYLKGTQSNDYSVQVTGSASSTGTCDLAPDIFADEDGDGIIEVTMIRDRTGLVMTDLTESNRDLPSNISNLPLEIDLNNMTVRNKEILVPADFSKVSDKRNIFRAYSHFFTNPKGCATLPTVPYGTDYGPYGFLEPKSISCDEVTSSDGNFTVNMGQLNLEDKGPYEYTDANGKLWRVFPHRFGKVDLDSCQVEYYGEITNLAFNPNEMGLSDFFEQMHETPYENEAFYENYLGVYKHNSFIQIQANNFQCGSKIYSAGTRIEDPDELKECYLYLSTLDESIRLNGRIDQASYFYFEVMEGDTTCDFDHPETCHGIGPIEKHVTPEGLVLDNYYNLTIYNAELNAYVITAGDRTSFLRHESHNIYTKFYINFTTKPIATEDDINGDYKYMIAENTKEHIDKEQIFLKDGEVYDLKKFWTEGGFLSEMSPLSNPEDLAESGVDYGGYGKGVYRKCSNPDICDIIPAGWPLSLESTHLVFNGLAAFNKTGNILPGFAKASGAKGKPLYFYMEGCLAPGHDIDPSRGCYPYIRDNETMPDDETRLIIDEYDERNMLPSGYPADPADCATFIEKGLNDPAHPEYDPYLYMTCINYQINSVDRDRQTNYYDKSNPFVYETNFYGASNCGYGM